MEKEKKEARIHREQEFYTKCAELLHTTHDYHVPYIRKTRWNARILGNGRFPGFGTIQMFGPSFIRVMLNKPVKITKVFDSVQDVYTFLEENV